MGNHVLEYYKQAGFEITKSDNSGSNGPCPECGGVDRFTIFHKAGGARKSARAPELGSFYCRGCNISGDVIKFMLNFCGYTFPAALEELGLENDCKLQSKHSGGGWSSRRKNKPAQKWSPQPEQYPGFVEDVEAWREHAEKFVTVCHEVLLKRQSALEYLACRGVGVEQIKRFRIGINLGRDSKKKGRYRPLYKQASAWGMPNLRRSLDGSHQKTIALNAGLVIPCYQRYGELGPSGDLLRINIRSFDRGYLISKGSLHFSQAQQIINPGQDLALIVESELDAFALSAILSGVTIIPMGSAGGVPGQAASRELRGKQLILLCLDRDKVGGKGLEVWRKNNPGLPDPVYALGAGVDRAPEKWFANYRQCQPWYCPAPYKDPGDAIKAGCDMIGWFVEGVAYYSVVGPLMKEKFSAVKVQAVPGQHATEQAGERIRPVPPQIPEWCWLLALLDRRKIDIKVDRGVVRLDFSRSSDSFNSRYLEEIYRIIRMPQIEGYLEQAKDGVWTAGQFRGC